MGEAVGIAVVGVVETRVGEPHISALGLSLVSLVSACETVPLRIITSKMVNNGMGNGTLGTTTTPVS